MPERLPIYDLETEIIARLTAQRRLILSAPTGSGKSTQVPQMLLRHGVLGTGQVVVLQPRRLAARLLAARVADELGVVLGREVGYQIRLDNVTSRATRIRFVTEGILLRQMNDDPELKGVSAIVFDEFHERHLYGDITLARALDLQESRRPDLALVVMSATMDSPLLAKYLATGNVLTSEGRAFPVTIEYSPRPSYELREPVWEQAADAFADYAGRGGPGDVLVFMPGGFEIHKTIEAIRQRREAKGYLLLPLHGELPARDQDAAVARHRQPKMVVATNVAETSLTIDGIRLVIDSGLARIARYDPYRGINTLLVEKISQAAADQRTGRAGRTAPGVCRRLWSAREHEDRHGQEKPEVQRLDLAEVVLTLKAAGVGDLNSFRWLEHPGVQRLEHAEELLLDLGALTRVADGPLAQAPAAGRQAACPAGGAAATSITEPGRRMLAFPLHPRYARMLLAAQEYGCVHEACLIAALTQGRDLLVRKVDSHAKDRREDKLGAKAASDLFLLMRAWSHAANCRFDLEECKKLGIHAQSARQVGPLFQQFLDIAKREGLDVHAEGASEEALQKCLLIGFSDRVARRADSGTLRCDLVHGRTGVLARESAVHHSELLVVAEIREVGRSDGAVNTILSLATAVRPEWLEEFYPDDLSREVNVFFDAQAKRVYADEVRTFRGLKLNAKRVEPPPLDAAAGLLADEVESGRLTLREWDHGVDQWIARLNCLAGWCPELGLPPIDAAARRSVIEQLCHGAFSWKDVKDRPVKPVVREWLGEVQRQMLDDHAPERVKLANGRTPKVTYAENEAPILSLRIQELYDVKETPRIALGRVPVVVHILAPNMRAVQVTQDLAGFWREHYPALKSQLARKYPRHEWR